MAAPGVSIVGWVVFTNESTFPKGTPPGVSQLSTFAHDIKDELPRTAGNPRLAEAWDRLKDPALSSKTEKRAHLAELRTRRGPNRRARLGWGLLAAALAIGIARLDNPGQTVNQLLRPAAKSITDGAQNVIASAVPTLQRPSQPATSRPVISMPPAAPTKPAAGRPAAVASSIEWSASKSATSGQTRESPACGERFDSAQAEV